MSEEKPKRTRRKKSDGDPAPKMPVRPDGWLYDLFTLVRVVTPSGDILSEGKYCGPSSSEKGKHIVKSNNIMLVPESNLREVKSGSSDIKSSPDSDGQSVNPDDQL